MRLYQTINSGTWIGTQADAKRLAKDERGSFEPVEVPTDKAGLIAFLNEQREGSISCPVDDPDCLGEDGDCHDACEAPAPVTPLYRSQEAFTADEIQDFLLNRATVAQCENIFACLGTRFAERRAA